MSAPSERAMETARELARISTPLCHCDERVCVHWEMEATLIIDRSLAVEREQCAKIADKWAQSHSCDSHDDNPCCHVRTGAAIRDAIRN